MDLHANAKLGLAGRREVVLVIEAGLSLRAPPAAFNVSPATLYRAWHRLARGRPDRRRSLTVPRDRGPTRAL
jgi:hypothetical protein